MCTTPKTCIMMENLVIVPKQVYWCPPAIILTCKKLYIKIVAICIFYLRRGVYIHEHHEWHTIVTIRM